MRGAGGAAWGLQWWAPPTDLWPAALAQAFHIVCGVLATFVAAGAWRASRVPTVRLEAGTRAELAGK